MCRRRGGSGAGGTCAARTVAAFPFLSYILHGTWTHIRARRLLLVLTVAHFAPHLAFQPLHTRLPASPFPPSLPPRSPPPLSPHPSGLPDGPQVHQDLHRRRDQRHQEGAPPAQVRHPDKPAPRARLDRGGAVSGRLRRPLRLCVRCVGGVVALWHLLTSKFADASSRILGSRWMMQASPPLRLLSTSLHSSVPSLQPPPLLPPLPSSSPPSLHLQPGGGGRQAARGAQAGDAGLRAVPQLGGHLAGGGAAAGGEGGLVTGRVWLWGGGGWGA